MHRRLKISITYSDSYISRYEYDASTKTYIRFRNGKPHMERITGEQLAAKNIIIQVVRNQRIKVIHRTGRNFLISEAAAGGMLPMGKL